MLIHKIIYSIWQNTDLNYMIWINSFWSYVWCKTWLNYLKQSKFWFICSAINFFLIHLIYYLILGIEKVAYQDKFFLLVSFISFNKLYKINIVFIMIDKQLYEQLFSPLSMKISILYHHIFNSLLIKIN